MIRVVAFTFCIVFLALLLKQKEGEIHFLLLLAGTLFLFSIALTELSKLFENVQVYLEKSSYIQRYIKQLLKILGITFLSDFGASICKDAGYPSMGKQLEMIGKITILALTIPLLLTVIETVFVLF